MHSCSQRQTSTGWLATLGWAIFLGMSWTWCIGMFLPVLMVREFGFWGWVVFAVPNVLGAAAMGWLLRDAQSSERITSHHAPVCAAFSAITIMFQISFIGWVGRLLVGQWAGVIMGVTALIVMLVGLWRWGSMITGAIVLALSTTAFILAPGYAVGLGLAGFPSVGVAFPTPLLWLTPVMIFGFLTCPYFDLTFHEARRGTSPRAGAAAFSIGFAGPFLLMIVFTLWYARLLLPISLGLRPMLPVTLCWLIGGHMSMQCGYTIGVHWRALRGDAGLSAHSGRMLGALVGFVAALAPLSINWLAAGAIHSTLTGPEMVYRLFIAFYGLVFPAYAWICMMPGRGAAPNRRQWRFFIIALIAAAPMFWMGFIERQMVWLVPGLCVILLGRAALWLDSRRIALSSIT